MAGDLRNMVIDAVWRAVGRSPAVRSATIAGSFSTGQGLDGIADIDTILIVDPLTSATFRAIQEVFREDLKSVLATAGYGLRINPMLGPLKYNDRQTAVLHLMLYSPEAHREHVIASPFTCLDWQRSPLWRLSRLDEVYPVFGLQPHHFLYARRGAQDYLGDLHQAAITYRELVFEDGGYREVKRYQPMDVRARHEFVHHLMRFLMQNFLKLVRRCNEVEQGERLSATYFAMFPEGADEFAKLFHELSSLKVAGNCGRPMPDLESRASCFVETFEAQFRREFHHRARRHLVFRHAPTKHDSGDGPVFQGRLDPGLTESPSEGVESLAAAVAVLQPQRVFASPLRRSGETLRCLARHVLNLPEPNVDPRLVEISYGDCEGLSTAQARERYPELFAAWQRGEDPAFPGGGENTADVLARVEAFAREHWRAESQTLACTHNVVLRCVIGNLLGLPQALWYRLRVPHLTPITLVATERFGLFVDLEEPVERAVMADFFDHPPRG